MQLRAKYREPIIYKQKTVIPSATKPSRGTRIKWPSAIGGFLLLSLPNPAILFGTIKNCKKLQKIVKKCAEMLKNPKKSKPTTIHHQPTTLKPTAGLSERSRGTRRIASAIGGFLPLSLMPYPLRSPATALATADPSLSNSNPI